jgi:hypothetical protein
MSEPIQPPSDPKLVKLAQELGDDVALAKKLLAAYKAGGWQAVSAVVPEAVKEVQEDYAAFEDALPAIKSGWKTTEFWITAVVAIGGVSLQFTALPTWATASAGIAAAVSAAVYTLSRSMIKSQ